MSYTFTPLNYTTRRCYIIHLTLFHFTLYQGIGLTPINTLTLTKIHIYIYI
ncbi:hypothetical protein Hdeb2414_s0223g00838781 [Helianthus debilis subsp. tardiflorus]